MTRMTMFSMALPALLLLTGAATPVHAQHDDPNMEWVMDGPLYDRLGGEEMIRGVIDDFVSAAVDEEQLKNQLEGVDQDVWKETLLAQFTAVAGGEIEYDGKSFKESLEEMGIAEESMDLVADQLTIALETNEAWPEDVDELLVALELKEAEMMEEGMTEGEMTEGEMTEDEMTEGEMTEDEVDTAGGNDHGEMEEGSGHDSDAGASDGQDAGGDTDAGGEADDAPRK